MIQRRRVRLRRRAAGTGPRGSPAGHTAAAGAARLDWLPGLRRQLPDHRRLRGSCRPPCPANSPGPTSCSCGSTCSSCSWWSSSCRSGQARQRSPVQQRRRTGVVTKHGLTLLAIRLLGSAMDARHISTRSAPGRADETLVGIGGELGIATADLAAAGSWLHSTWTSPGGALDGRPRSPCLDDARM